MMSVSGLETLHSRVVSEYHCHHYQDAFYGTDEALISLLSENYLEFLGVWIVIERG